jgi:glycosyltransferase involved in cell wall biosynthesis
MISVIINTYNRSEILIENLLNLKPIWNKAEIIIVDDCSTDNTASAVNEFIKKNDIQAKFILNNVNRGYPKSMNIGIKEASNDSVFILNDDVFIFNPENFIKILEKDLEKEYVVVTRLKMDKSFSMRKRTKFFLYSIPARLFAGEIYNYNGKKRRHVKYGNNIFCFNKSKLKILFDEKNYAGNFFRIESDFQSRARSSGFKILYDPELFVLDKWAPSGGLRQQSKKKFLHWCIFNHIIFLRKNFSLTKYYKIPFYFLLKTIAHPYLIVDIIKISDSAFKREII